MTFVSDQNQKCCGCRLTVQSDVEKFIGKRVKDFDLNIILPKDACAGLRKRKKKQLKASKSHLERLERLSRPKKTFIQSSHTMTGENKEKPLDVLLTRLAQLARPRRVTTKYQKPLEETIFLPGNITDWAAHKKWLALRAVPKASVAEPTTRSNLCLKTKKHHRRRLVTSERVQKLSCPKVHMNPCLEYKSKSRVLKFSNSAMA